MSMPHSLPLQVLFILRKLPPKRNPQVRWHLKCKMLPLCRAAAGRFPCATPVLSIFLTAVYLLTPYFLSLGVPADP